MSEVPLYPLCTEPLPCHREIHIHTVPEPPVLLGGYVYRGTSLIKKRPPPEDPPRTLGTGLRKGPRGVRFLVSEVPL